MKAKHFHIVYFLINHTIRYILKVNDIYLAYKSQWFLCAFHKPQWIYVLLSIFQCFRRIFSQIFKGAKTKKKIFPLNRAYQTILFRLKSMWLFNLLTLNHWNYLEAVQVHLSGVKPVKW